MFLRQLESKNSILFESPYSWDFFIHNNDFTGTLVLNQPYVVEIASNGIKDIIITDSGAFWSNRCDLSDNPLLGNSNVADFFYDVLTDLLWDLRCPWPGPVPLKCASKQLEKYT